MKAGRQDTQQKKMNKYLKFASLTLITSVGFGLGSCSDDDEPNGSTTEPSIENVFAEGLPASISGATFTTNAKGQVTKIAQGSTSITFEYGKFTPSRGNNFTVLMKERDTNYPDEGSDIYMQLNNQGFVEYAYQVYLDDEDDEAEEYWFEYNNDGQLTHFRRSENEDDYRVTYANGDITKVVHTDEDGDRDEYEFRYTNDENPNVVANKACLMMYEDFFQLNDMDDMDVVYFTGMLGKATKNLPMGYTEKDGDDTYTVNYHWEFNADKLPVKFRSDTDWEAITFSWK